jgi:TetR/AcrR family transcriptional regulator, transcriptional repressor for nem operon
MRKSRSEAAETRARIVSTASKMFLDQGIAAVGTREVMAGADLTPGGFYRHFASKDQLIAEAIGAAFDRLIAMFESETQGMPAAEAVERIVWLYLHQSLREQKPYLCPLSMLGAELSHADPQVREVAMNGYRHLIQLIATHYPGLTKSEALLNASGIVSTIVGAVTLADIAPDAATQRDILRDAQAIVRNQYISATRSKRKNARV